ncbi:hypothetical protein ASF53_06160 [Methylobacterium sp. Leaf123]|nr:hypothetical protein ASF53_06160 [Methylobacterium sp. Leaf123]
MQIGRQRGTGRAGFALRHRLRSRPGDRSRRLHRLTVRYEPGRREENETGKAPSHRSEGWLFRDHHEQQAAESGGHAQKS